MVEHTIVHRQGNIYGAEQGKRLCLFVDDMNVLQQHESGTQITNEVTRDAWKLTREHSRMIFCEILGSILVDIDQS